MRAFLFIYTLAMIAFSVFTLGLVPRSLRDIGRERQKLKQEAPEASFERMVEAGYRLNTLLVLVEVFYYFLLLRYLSGHSLAMYTAFTFGVVHIFYLIMGRWERRRLFRGKTRARGVRQLILFTAFLTFIEVIFLGYAGVLLTVTG